MTKPNKASFHNEEMLSTMQLGRRLGIHVTVKFLQECGISPLADYGKKNGTYWRATDFPIICMAIARYMQLKATS